MYITTSDYLSFRQCPKLFSLSVHLPDTLSSKKDTHMYEKELRLPSLFQQRFPGGTLVPSHLSKEEKVTQTRFLIDSGISIIYQAAFEWEGLFIEWDVMMKRNDGWSFYGLASSTKPTERHIDNLSFRTYVTIAQIQPDSIYLAYVNNAYVREETIDVRSLFHIQDMTATMIEQVDNVPVSVAQMKKIKAGGNIDQEIGEYCLKYGKEPLECPAKNHCWAHVPAYSVFNLARIGKKAFDLAHNGILSLDDIPESYTLTANQRSQVMAHQQQTSLLDQKQLHTFLKSFSYPLYFLDFETCQHPVPLFSGTRPYQQLPFQYSLHILDQPDANLIHLEHLAKEGKDPRRSLAEQLVKDIPAHVTTVAYNMSFEKMILRQLAEDFPDLSFHLLSIHDGMLDLMVPFQKKWFYTPEMKGSYSIKYVLPALFPNDEMLDYQRLTIQNGSMAMDIYATLHTRSTEEIRQIRQDLLAYCQLDTYAMIKIWHYLSKM